MSASEQHILQLEEIFNKYKPQIQQAAELEDLLYLSTEELEELADEVEMKRPHLRQLLNGLKSAGAHVTVFAPRDIAPGSEFHINVFLSGVEALQDIAAGPFVEHELKDHTALLYPFGTFYKLTLQLSEGLEVAEGPEGNAFFSTPWDGQTQMFSLKVKCRDNARIGENTTVLMRTEVGKKIARAGELFLRFSNKKEFQFELEVGAGEASQAVAEPEPEGASPRRASAAEAAADALMAGLRRAARGGASRGSKRRKNKRKGKSQRRKRNSKSRRKSRKKPRKR